MKTNAARQALTNAVNRAIANGSPVFINQKFAVGQRVTAVGFVDCFGKTIEPTPDLVISEVKLIPGSSIPAYYRYVASDVHGFPRVEGAERFFEPA